MWAGAKQNIQRFHVQQMGLWIYISPFEWRAVQRRQKKCNPDPLKTAPGYFPIHSRVNAGLKKNCLKKTGEGTEITWADSENPFQDRVSAPVTAHICYANDLGQLGVDLNAVIESWPYLPLLSPPPPPPASSFSSLPGGPNCHSWRQTAVVIKKIQVDL